MNMDLVNSFALGPLNGYNLNNVDGDHSFYVKICSIAPFDTTVTLSVHLYTYYSRQVVEIWTDFLVPNMENMTAVSVVPTIKVKNEETVWIQDSDRFDAQQILT